MSNKLLRNLTWVHAFAIALLFSSNLSAATFTAAASGNWSSSATWVGGTTPGTTSTDDIIVIGSGITVNLDQNVTINGLMSSLQVQGALSTNNSSDLTLTQGSLVGSGDVMVDELSLGALAIVTFTGGLTANSFSSAATSVTLALNLTVNQTLQLMAGTLTFGSGSSLNLASNSTIMVNGGTLGLLGTGVLNLNGSYNVIYNGNSANSGLELSGSGLNNLTINLSTSNQSVTLINDITVDGILSIQGGQLNTNGNNLTLNGGFLVSGSGSIGGNIGTNITLNGSTGGSLSFASNAQTINNFTINLPSSATVDLNSDLTVSGNFSNTSGTVDIRDVSLTVGGNLSGSGRLQTNSNSSLALNGSTNISGNLNFTSGTMGTGGGTLGNLTVALGTSNNVSLSGDVTISGMLTLTSGSLSLNGSELMLTGNISGSGTGTISGGNGASISIMSNGNVTGNLSLTAGGSNQRLDELVVNIANNGSISLGSNITIVNALELESGNLNLNGNTITVAANADIMLNGGASVLGIGNFDGSAGYNLILSGSGNVNIGIFGSGNNMNDLSLDLDNGGMATLGSDLTVNGTLELLGGSLDLDGYNLNLNGNITGIGNGNIISDSSSSIAINSATSTTGSLNFSASGNTLGSLSVNIADGGLVSLRSELTIEDELTFTAGKLLLADGDLTIASGGQITGANSNSYIITNGEGSLQLNVAGSGTRTFAVGTQSNYTPAEITLNGSSNGMFSVRVDEGVLSNGTSGNNSATVHSVVNATWFVESTMSTAMDIDLQVEWTSNMEVNGFNRDSAYISHYTAGAWDTDAEANAIVESSGRFSLTRTGITSLSPFAVFDTDAAVGVREIAAIENLSIYPNPTANMLNIPADAYASTIKIIDLNGATVIETTRAAYESATINVGALSNGLYLVKVIGENQISTGRFVKN